MTASLLAKFTYLLFLSLATANQTSDRLRKELREAFLDWIPIRRHSKEELEHLERNLRLTKPSIDTRTAFGVAMGAALTASFTFGASLMVAAAGAGIGALIGAGASYLSAEEEKRIRLAEVQVAIEKDRKACIRLQELLDSLNRTFSSTTSAGAIPGAMVQNVSDALKRASRFADPSVLPRDITQLVKSSLDRHRGSKSPIVAEIRSVLDNLKCPDDAEIERLVFHFRPNSPTPLDLWTKARVLEDFDSAETRWF